MKEQVISQSSRLQRSRPSNCDWCNGADWQETILTFHYTYICHTCIYLWASHVVIIYGIYAFFFCYSRPQNAAYSRHFSTTVTDFVVTWCREKKMIFDRTFYFEDFQKIITIKYEFYFAAIRIVSAVSINEYTRKTFVPQSPNTNTYI